MFRISRYTISVVLALSIGIAGLTSILVMAGQQHAAMMDQSSIACMSYCVNSAHLVTTLPTTLPILQLFVGFLVIAALSLPQLKLAIASYSARPRPSPNLIKLYAHYLD